MSTESVKVGLRLRARVAGWCIRFALWCGRVAALPMVEKTGPAPRALRVEADVETPLSGAQLAALLRRLAVGDAHAATLRSLASEVEHNHRPAPHGTRGTILTTGTAMVMDAAAVGDAAADLYRNTRRVTREPGELVEIQVSVVVTSHATSIDPTAPTRLGITLPGGAQ